MNKPTFLLVWLFFATFAPPLTAESLPAERTLSPYFFVEGEAGGEQFPLLGTKVEVAVSGVVAKVKVRQQYANRGAQPIHARYIFPGSTRAAVHGLKMTIGERVVVAQIKEKEAARQIFAAAKHEGKNASLLEQQRPNVFSMEVANMLPGDNIDVELDYTELLVPTEGVYEFVYPTVVGPRYSNQPEEGAPDGEQWVQNPYLKTGSAPRTAFDLNVTLAAGMPLQEVICTSHAATVGYDSPDKARITLATSEFGGDRDYILRYRLADKEIASGLLLYQGEEENFFLLMAQPPARPQPAQIPGREYIFVVDVSGSMNGFPLDASKRLLKDLVGSLKPEDSFNLLLFAGNSETMAPTSVPATADNVRRALALLDRQQGRGGTELVPAMHKALALPRGESVARSLLVITDGFIAAEQEVFRTIEENLDTTNVFAFGIGSSVNRHLIEGIARAGQGEPFIVTDPGEAPAVARRFCEYVAAPVLTDVKVEYQGFSAYDVEPVKIPDLFAQRPLIVFGKWRGDRTGTITVSGVNGAGPYAQSFQVDKVEPQPANEGLRHLWARERIARISDYNTRQNDPEQRAEIVNLGLTYNLLTAHTSFVAVDEVVRNPGGQGQEVKQPLPLPKGVSNLAVGGGGMTPMTATPEPETWLLAGLLLALAGMRFRSAHLSTLITPSTLRALFHAVCRGRQ